mgnify:CR=1 FL=1
MGIQSLTTKYCDRKCSGSFQHFNKALRQLGLLLTMFLLESEHGSMSTIVNSRYSGHPGDRHLVSVIARVRYSGVR